MQLRETQAAILEYQGGKMGVAAVPGSGKTFILTRLAAKLIANGHINLDSGQQILIVTYLNASVENFKSRMRVLLEEEGLNTDLGYDVRTLHSLGLEILRTQYGGDAENNLIVLDGGQSTHFLNLAIEQWRDLNPDFWIAMNSDVTEAGQARWLRKVERMSGAFIREAKNLRYRPTDIEERLKPEGERPDEEMGRLGDGLTHSLRSEMLDGEIGSFGDELDDFRPLLVMLNGIYTQYQALVARQGALDYNDLIWQATDLIEKNPDLTRYLRYRWPFVLEDEAQDSVPLQEILLDTLTGDGGGWVRVGDPNQAITSSFTAARPRYLTDFLDRPDVQARPLPHSGRCAPKILEAANKLLRWTTTRHPVPEVRRTAFRPQDILPTPAGDAQPNPPDEEARIVIKVYSHREDEELPKVARLAGLYMEKFAERTVAILTPTHDIGHRIAENLDAMEITYDNLLRGGTREREIAAAIHGVLNVMVNPLRGENFRQAFLALRHIDHPAASVLEQADVGRFEAILRSVRQPEKFLFPNDWRDDVLSALPVGIPKADDLDAIAQFAAFIQKNFDYRLLPIDDLIISIGDEVLGGSGSEFSETDLAIAYQIANLMRSWGDLNPEWR
ncbi:MAG: ATP-dependent helicase, partial [Chloroflexota bacterium]